MRSIAIAAAVLLAGCSMTAEPRGVVGKLWRLEVADALVAETRLAEQRKAQEAQVEALRNALDLSLARYGTGLANYIEVLDAAQLLYPAESALAETQPLGGGWQMPGEQVAAR